MRTQRGKITGKHKEHPIHLANPAHFSFEATEAIEPETVLANPNFTLYCFDLQQDVALFVECPDDVRVEQSPFYYLGQYENGTHIATMPLETFHRLAKTIPEPPKGLIFIHSVGRCGSTLVSKALDAIPTVHSLSEPDEFSQAGSFRAHDGSKDDWLADLLESSVRWRCKPRHGAPAEKVALKFRSEVLGLGDLLYQRFPHAKHPFLYRDGLTWMRSNFKGYPPDRDMYDPENNRLMAARWGEILPILSSYADQDPPLNPVQIRILGWVTCMEAYLGLLEKGMPPFAIRFEDLTAHPKEMLTHFFRFCEIDVPSWEAIEEVLGKDSQDGTHFSRAERQKVNSQLTDALVLDVHNMIATRPLLKVSNVVLPGTAFPV